MEPTNFGRRSAASVAGLFALFVGGCAFGPSGWGWGRDAEPIHLAAHSGNTTLVRQMIANGVDLDAETRAPTILGKGSFPWTPLTLAIHGGHEDTAIAIASELEARDGSGGYDAGLLTATRFGNTRLMQRFLELGGDLDLRDRDGDSLLHIAAKNDDMPSVRFLLDAGIDPDIRDDLERTPLNTDYFGCRRLEIPTLLIDAGADVNSSDRLGYTPLLRCGDYQSPEAFIELLLAHGADPTAAVVGPGDAGVTPLMQAAMYGDGIGAMQLLIDAGADPHRTNAGGLNALNYAALNGFGTSRLAEEKIRFLLDRGVDPNASGTGGWGSPAGAAVWFCRADALAMLLAAGADPLVTDQEGNTLLELAHKRFDNQLHFGPTEARYGRKWDRYQDGLRMIALLEAAEQEALKGEGIRGATP